MNVKQTEKPVKSWIYCERCDRGKEYLHATDLALPHLVRCTDCRRMMLSTVMCEECDCGIDLYDVSHRPASADCVECKRPMPIETAVYNREPLEARNEGEWRRDEYKRSGCLAAGVILTLLVGATSCLIG